MKKTLFLGLIALVTAYATYTQAQVRFDSDFEINQISKVPVNPNPSYSAQGPVPDVTGECVYDSEDIDLFMTLFDEQSPDADLDENGEWTSEDVFEFLRLFADIFKNGGGNPPTQGYGNNSVSGIPNTQYPSPSYYDNPLVEYCGCRTYGGFVGPFTPLYSWNNNYSFPPNLYISTYNPMGCYSYSYMGDMGSAFSTNPSVLRDATREAAPRIFDRIKSIAP